jgi:hypothetical protein
VVKNIAELIRVYRLLTDLDAVATATKKTQKVARKFVRRGVFSLAGLAIIVGAVILVQHLSLKPPATSASIPAPRSLAQAMRNTPSIAVLPFVNICGDREQEYFSDGITSDLVTTFSKPPGIL